MTPPRTARSAAAGTGLDWGEVRRRYRTEVPLPPLAGASRPRAVLVDDDTIRVSQRLWTALITRDDLETAVALLDRTPGPVSAVGFAEVLRRFHASTTECSRVPNLSAMVLADLGLLPTR
jgi:hypothetical protein